MGDQGVEIAIKQTVDQSPDLVVQPYIAGENSVVTLATIFLFGPDRALLHQAMEKGLDGGVAPRLAGLHLVHQRGGGQGPAAPQGGENGALRFGDGDAGQDRSTARSMRASTTQLQITATTPAIRPSTKMKAASATPGASTL